MRTGLAVGRSTNWVSRCALLSAVLLSVAFCCGACSGGSSDDRDGGASERVTVELGGGDLMSYIESLPVDDREGTAALPDGGVSDIPVVFLHGAAYDAGVWSDLGLLEGVAAEGRRAVAIDLPGKGESSGEADGDWLAQALDALDIAEAVVVSPSASGPVAFGLLSEQPERVAGFVPVAPVGAADFEWTGGAAPETVVVLGEEDRGFGEATRELAAEIPDADLVVIPDAGHAAYEDAPSEFLEVLRSLF